MITSTALVLLMIPGVGYVALLWLGCKFELTLIKILLLWTREEKVCALAAMAFCHGYGCHQFPMVFLGLLSGFLAHCGQVHW